MLKYRNSLSFFTTIMLYVGVGIVWYAFQNQYITLPTTPKEQILTLALSQIEPEPILPEEVKEEPVVEEKPIVKPSEPIVQKSIPKLHPIVKKKIKKKAKPKKKRIHKKKIKKRVIKKAKIKSTKKHKTKQMHAKSHSSKQVSPARKNAFLSQVRAKINRYKKYPRIAERRGIKGSVKARFTILANGHVSGIVLSGKKVFYASVRSAIQKAFPIVTKNIPLSLPTIVNVALHYH